MAAPQPVAENYTQPTLPWSKSGWIVNGIDYQIVTKSDGWNQDQTKRLNEYEAGKSLCGINYAAIGCPYDNLTKIQNYEADARTKGLKIIWRMHWNAWQGDNGVGNIATNNSLTSSGTTATCVTSTPHGMVTGQTVSLNGMNETAYRGEFTVTVINSTTFTFTLPTTATSPATGNIGWRYGRQTYLDKTYDFIVANPGLFEAGDIFATCVESDQADASNMTFKTPGTTSFNTSIYNQFQKDQVRYANAAFTAIGMGGQILTSPISQNLSNLNLNGQTLDSGSTGNSQGLGDSDIVTYFGGLLSIDHYLSDSYRYTDATKYWDRYSSDLDKIHAAFPSCKIMISEWGYITVPIESGKSTGSNSSTTLRDTGKSWTTNVFTGTITITGGTGAGQIRSISSNTSNQITISSSWSTIPDNTSDYQINIAESERAGMYRQVINVLRSKSYIYGVCFWNHMGQTSSSIFTDNSSIIVTDGLLTPREVKHAFTTGNKAYGMRVRV